MGAIVALVTLSGCSAEEAMRFGWPEGVTPEATDMQHLWTWSVIAALVMGVLVWALVFWTITFHRKPKDGPEFPRQTAYNVPLELGYTAVPFLIIAVLFYFTVIVQNKVLKLEDNPPVTVDVTAMQWNWRFAYREVTFSDGEKKSFEIPSEDSPYGQQPEDGIVHEEDGHIEKGANNGAQQEIRDYLRFSEIEIQGSTAEVPVLVLPTNTRIEFDIASSDVVHSFFIPKFLFKRDVMPNPEQNHSESRFQISEIDTEGAFVGRCAEMCGTYHSMMNFEIRAVTPEKFDKYIEAREAGLTNAKALESIGEEGVATSTKPFDRGRTSREAADK